MITGYFGVPGVGKTTMLTKIARKALKSRRYAHVYTNFYCLGCEQIDFQDLIQYKLYDSLIVLDELTLDADNRNFKSFPKEIRDFFVLHRHLGCDIVYATQSFELVDLKIRQLTHDLWYLTRSVVPFFSLFVKGRRIYRNININEHTSELTLGYRFCRFFELIFASNFKMAFTPFYYRYFDTSEEGSLERRPLFDSTSWGDVPCRFKIDFRGKLDALTGYLHSFTSQFREGWDDDIPDELDDMSRERAVDVLYPPDTEVKGQGVEDSDTP